MTMAAAIGAHRAAIAILNDGGGIFGLFFSVKSQLVGAR